MKVGAADVKEDRLTITEQVKITCIYINSNIKYLTQKTKKTLSFQIEVKLKNFAFLLSKKKGKVSGIHF